jgi:3-methyladenine DNA glycosylase AlkC
MSERQQKKLFKDWFDAEAAELLTAQFVSAWPEFDANKFIALATYQLEQLEFHGRVRQFSDALRETLPQDIPTALQIITRSLPPVLPGTDDTTNGWLQWPVGHWIADHAVDHPDLAFEVMRELTQRFTSEFAIRPFVERYPEKTFTYLLDNTTHPSPHVRRWCSEGVRPRLPWGKRLNALLRDPSPILPILESLKDDSSRYVQKSVANCLNDIGKDNAAVLVQVCSAWQQDKTPQRSWIIRHALRSLIKKGNPDALNLLGYSQEIALHTTLTLFPQKLRIGDSITMQATLHNTAPTPVSVVLDFAVDYVRQRGKTSNKVFKWKNQELGPDQRIQLTKKLAFTPNTTRALYPGEHRIYLQLNGVRHAEAWLSLVP